VNAPLSAAASGRPFFEGPRRSNEQEVITHQAEAPAERRAVLGLERHVGKTATDRVPITLLGRDRLACGHAPKGSKASRDVGRGGVGREAADVQADGGGRRRRRLRVVVVQLLLLLLRLLRLRLIDVPGRRSRGGRRRLGRHRVRLGDQGGGARKGERVGGGTMMCFRREFAAPRGIGFCCNF
jgi:hypothetical protein